jgi:hypothetical protein
MALDPKKLERLAIAVGRMAMRVERRLKARQDAGAFGTVGVAQKEATAYNARRTGIELSPLGDKATGNLVTVLRNGKRQGSF